ncbi:phosphatidylethanolamine-binding protein 4 [Oryzias melastigma]|uniref:Phosphatidylethanolamine binding protein 4 n=1 Tax=Oryzias melastigma TaxID=30732 RepID=A0A3B3BQY7_ORYME|nr:phosphatidylethanolamine-binding protein 4 [Oryzias melastigma]
MICAAFLLTLLCIVELHVVETSKDAPDYLEPFFCHGGLEVIYPELDVDKCLIISKDRKLREKISRTWKAPEIHFPGAKKGKLYVLVMVDPDAPSRAKPTSAYWRHWLVVNIEGNDLKKGKMRGKILTEYDPPTPPQKSGFHRYQIMLFEQLPHTPVLLSDEEKSSRGKWDFPAFITRFNLGEPVAALQFLTQNFKD